MIIVIPMAGQSQRFADEGYGPKYALPLGGAAAFDWVVSSFKHYFADANFVFVTQSAASDKFVDTHAGTLGIEKVRAISDPSQQGYGMAAFNGLTKSGLDLNQPIITDPIDTYRPEFRVPENLGNNNFAEMCITGAPNAARLNGYVRKPKFLTEPPPGQSLLVNPMSIRTLPWRRATGLFFFQRAASFTEAFQVAQKQIKIPGRHKILELPEWVLTLREINKRHSPVKVRLVNRPDVVFIGNPREYRQVRNDWPARFTLAVKENSLR